MQSTDNRLVPHHHMDGRLDRLSSMLRRRGVLSPAFEPYGGVRGLAAYGPVGGTIRSRFISIWLDHWAQHGDLVEIDAPVVTPYEVLDASGHVDQFTDPIATCSACGETHRADHLIGEEAEGWSIEDIRASFIEDPPGCTSCGTRVFDEIQEQNLMFTTNIGIGAGARRGFLRPETAQGMFTAFPMLHRHFRERLPFGAMQVGRGYRNEISPRQGMIRLREFSMAEIEYFIDPEATWARDRSSWPDETITLVPSEGGERREVLAQALDAGLIRHPIVAHFMAWTLKFALRIGLDADRLRFRQHGVDEMAHYAQDCWDLEVNGSYGWIECVGIAHRGCHDLQSHEDATGHQFRSFRPFDEPMEVHRKGWTLEGSSAGPAFRADAPAVRAAVEALAADVRFPTTVEVEDGRRFTIEAEHVKSIDRTEVARGTWFLPHVIEPAFGIDRLIWHLLDHAYDEQVTEEGTITKLRLHEDLAPYDVLVAPLFTKDGMDDVAMVTFEMLLQIPGLRPMLDTSRSIGRRYARADEIGIPWSVTIDHQTLEDETVTIRRRDDQVQVRVARAALVPAFTHGHVASLFD